MTPNLSRIAKRFEVRCNDLAVQLKLDELLRAVETARTGLVDLEDSTDEEIEKLRLEFQQLHANASANPKS